MSATATISLGRSTWRHPEWWSLALCAGAWTWLLRGHAHAHTFSAQLTNWLVMTLAMMLPMVIVPIRTTARRSLWHRRDRAIAAFLLGYLGCWTVAGIAVSFLHVTHPLAGTIGFAVAGAWQLTRWKRIALAGCHRTEPLAPRGWRADRDCMRYGVLIGVNCVLSCWALMLACFLSGHTLLATLIATAIALAERYTIRPDQRLLACALFAAALAAAQP
jgi:predicted metal-binding membrane protein